MFGALFLLLNPLCADTPDTAPSTIAAPAPRVVTPELHYAHAARPRATVGDVDSMLECWAWATKQNEPLSASHKESLRLSVTTALNRHAAMTVERLSGAIDPELLRSQFEWKLIASPNENSVCLQASPTDETERLFYGSVVASLNAWTWQLERLQVTDRNGKVAVDRTAPAAERAIITAAYVPKEVQLADGVPPSPTGGALRNTVPQEPTRRVLGVRNPPLLLQQNGTVIRTASTSDAVPEDSPIAGDIAKILADCEAASRNLKSLRISLTRTTYDLKSETETIAEGELLYEAPDKFRLTLKPAKIAPGSKSGRLGKTSTPFRVVSGTAETWIWTPTRSIYLDDDAKTCEWTSTANSPDSPREKAASSMSPKFSKPAFLIDLQADQLQRDWLLQLNSLTTSTAKLTATPRTPELARQVRKCLLIVDTRSGHISALKCFEASGEREVVYTINQLKANSVPPDSFNPSLKGYSITHAANAEN